MALDLIISILIGLLLFFTLHLILWRAWPSNQPRIILLTTLFATGACASLLFSVFRHGYDLHTLASILWIHIFCGIAYLFFYAGISRSVSVTILVRILDNGNKPIAFSDLERDYLASGRFEDRITAMEANKWIIRSEKTASLTNKGKIFARGVKILSHYLSEGLEG